MEAAINETATSDNNSTTTMNETTTKLEAEGFKPNILNTTVYIISVALQISTFAVNYRVSSFFFFF